MATPFSKIYERFLSNVTDYKLAKLDDIILEENLETWLKTAITMFPNPKSDLSDIDASQKSFNEELVNYEIEVLAKFMVTAYMNTHLIHEDFLSRNLTSKDYHIYSPANQLKALQSLKESIREEANSIISKNSYTVQNLKKLMEKKD